jgi:hypothetical protein
MKRRDALARQSHAQASTSLRYAYVHSGAGERLILRSILSVWMTNSHQSAPLVA